MENNAFVVLKFGGTSVATLKGWQTLATQLRRRQDEGLVPLVVHSALSQVSNQLESLLVAACDGVHAPLLAAIRSQHDALAREMGVDGDRLDADFATLERLTAGIAMLGEVSPRQRARVVAHGELLATQLGLPWLRAQGLNVAAIDAREFLLASAGCRRDEAHYLSAHCDDSPDPRLARLLADAGAGLTQGFIARDDAGDTVLLGRGGSDTSAAYFACKLNAKRLEIWTDVPGMYSADPRLVPGARLLRRLDYAEAQEIASTGGRVLHPRALPPVRRAGIPVRILSTREPDAGGTLISADPGSRAPRLKAIAARRGVTLISMETAGMWQEAGFLARAFAVFANENISIDLISSSETSVTVSLDPAPASHSREALDRAVQALSAFCQVRVQGQCAAISLVGREVRAILHELAPAFEVFREYEIYLVSQAANDLNFTFVVDENHADRLVQRLHDLLIPSGADDPVMGARWSDRGTPATRGEAGGAWWVDRRSELLALADTGTPLFVYDEQTLRDRARDLTQLSAIRRIFYSIKANPNADVLRVLAASGIGFECVSRQELDWLLQTLPDIDRDGLLFTPNFAAREEYAHALHSGIRVTIDNLWVLQQWPELFAGCELVLRVDPGDGAGHHRYVQTAGKHSKFGVPADEVMAAVSLANACGARITALHAHKGSGIVDHRTWARTALTLHALAEKLPDVRVLNLGGGLGVPDARGGKRLDIAALDAALSAALANLPERELWLEPGRYLVAEAGVLLARVTQVKDKDGVRYVGLNAGMNTLLRPALYGAFHEIVNLTRLHEPADQLVDVVGPICESADVLGTSRLLPATCEDDVVLVATAGAYGRVMSSNYNLRPLAGERLLASSDRRQVTDGLLTGH